MTEATIDKREPVAYTVTEKSLVGNKIYEAGETAMYDGLPAENLAPTCAIGEARYQEYLDTNKVRIAKMVEHHSDSAMGDPAAFGKLFLEALAKSNEDHAAQMAAFQLAQTELIAKTVAAAMASAFPNGTAAKAWTPKGAKADKVTTEDPVA